MSSNMRDLGHVTLSADCAPRPRPNAQLFQPWPQKNGVSPLEPKGNPAYEGTGYPAAGYGQSRRRVVKLAQPKVNGQPVLNRVVRSDLNSTSDQWSRTVIATLSGIGGLGCNCTRADGHMLQAMKGLSSALGQSGALWDVQTIANAIANNAVPEALLNQLTEKLIADDKANSEAYKAIQVLKRVDAKNPRIPALEKLQQEAWGQTNTAKFYALLVPEMQKRLGFTIGKPMVTKPDYAYIKNVDSAGVFTKVAGFLREKLTEGAVEQLTKAGYMADSSKGLAGLGFVQIAIGLGVAAVVAAGIIAYMNTHNASATREQALSVLTQARTSGKMSQADFEAAVKQINAVAVAQTGDFDMNAIAKTAGLVVGGLVLLQVFPLIRDAFRR